jgi:hypothetical protein
VKDTNLQTEFLLQIRKLQEDSAILLASNRLQHKDKTQNRPTEMEKQNFKGKNSREQTKNKWSYKKLPTYKTLNKIILKTPKAEIRKRNFSLLSNPLVLFRRIFKG